jgi:hypothetical protein
MTIKQNLVNGRGETFSLNLFFKDSLGVPVDLTGHSVDLIVKKSGVGTDVGTYPASVDADGNIEIVVTDEVTATWPVGKLAYVVNHTTADGTEKWLLYGALTVLTGVDV